LVHRVEYGANVIGILIFLIISRNDQMDELLAKIWNKLMHIMHGNGVVPPPTLELAATRSHRNTLRRRVLRQAQTDKLSSAMFMVDLQLKSLRNAVKDIQDKLPIDDGQACTSLALFSRDTLLQARAQMPDSGGPALLLPTTMLRHTIDIMDTMPAQAPVLFDNMCTVTWEPPSPPAEEACVHSTLPVAPDGEYTSFAAHAPAGTSIDQLYLDICDFVPEAQLVLASWNSALLIPTLVGNKVSQPLSDLLWGDGVALGCEHLDEAFRFYHDDDGPLFALAQWGGMTRQGFSFYWDNRAMDARRGFLQSRGIGFNEALEHFDGYVSKGAPDSCIADFLCKDSVAHADTVSLQDVDSEIRGLLERHPLVDVNADLEELDVEEVFWDWLSRAGLSGPDFLERCVQIAVDLRRQPCHYSAASLTRSDPPEHLLERARAALTLLAFDEPPAGILSPADPSCLLLMKLRPRCSPLG
jgi:hypothetical protein